MHCAPRRVVRATMIRVATARYQWSGPRSTSAFIPTYLPTNTELFQYAEARLERGLDRDSTKTRFTVKFDLPQWTIYCCLPNHPTRY